MIYAGIDAGSRTIKVVLTDAAGKKILAKGITDQGVEQNRLASELFEKVLKKNGSGRKDVAAIVATGYGRNAVNFADTTITEITCHAVGVHQLVPDAMTVIDIGGQDSKLLKLDGSGKVRDFAMNDRCAAGTGRFLEVVAQRLGVEPESLGKIAAKSKNPAAISSMCVVFAETEIVGLLASGTSRQDIVAGVQAAIAARIVGMAGRKVKPPIVFTGGVALIPGMDAAMKTALGQDVKISPQPQFTGALGAAIIASGRLNGEKINRK
ncbi:MAG: 2-hydroxyglutaryl-CoA dehydratase [Sedimentisphaerales bacterium]|nr:2-hydroxyglutaryl-CoA dehydratase [Sedimentisphaerales bacterium]